MESSSSLAASAPAKIYQLQKEEELRFEVDSSHQVEITLNSGTVESFGTELIEEKNYLFVEGKFALFTWYGCELTVKGQPKVIYQAADTPMSSYLALHGNVLQPKREEVKQRQSDAEQRKEAENQERGPIVLIVGPQDSGRSSIARILLNYATRAGSKPIFVDLDCSVNAITIPGCLSATPVEQPIAPEVGDFLRQKSPLSLFYGLTAATQNTDLYIRLLQRLSASVSSRLNAVPSSRSSGAVINMPSWVDGPSFEPIIQAICASFGVNVLAVVGQERLYAQLRGDPRLKDVYVEKLAKSGGVVNRDITLRQQLRNESLSEYFYGRLPNKFSPHQKILSFKDVVVWRVGGTHAAPNSALPIGSKRLVDPNALMKAPFTMDLLHSILAVSFAVNPAELGDSVVAGFVWVSAIDLTKKTISILCPAPGPLPSPNLIQGQIRWTDQ